MRFSPAMGRQVFPALIVILALLFFFPYLGSVHLFDWDEINFAESAREMLISGQYGRVMIDFRPFWEKPPLFFWMQAACMSIFGINEMAARLPNAIFGLITLLSIYKIGSRLYNPVFGMIWALCYLGAFLPHVYAKSGIIDPVFNYFIFMAIYYLADTIHHYGNPKAHKTAILAGICTGLAVLAKGPVGFLIILLSFLVFTVLQRFKLIAKPLTVIIYGISAFLVSFCWFGMEIYQHGFWFLNEFITYQIRLLTTPDAGHSQPFYYHFVVVLIGCFPISLIALPSFLYKGLKDELRFRAWMLIVFWVVLILFSLVTTKIVHYSSMAWLPVSFLAAYYLYAVLQKHIVFSRALGRAIVVGAAVWGVLLTIVPFIDHIITPFLPHIKDPFAVAILSGRSGFGGWEALAGPAYLVMVCLALRYLHQAKTATGIVVLLLSTALCVLFASLILTPKIEQLSQASAINHYELARLQTNGFAHPLGFKSYAHLFYAQKPGIPAAFIPYACKHLSLNTKDFVPIANTNNSLYYLDKNPQNYDQVWADWLINDTTAPKALFVSKIDRFEDIKKQFPFLVVTQHQKGFVFFEKPSRP